MLPRTTPEQRSQYYEDVETLLTPGFLTHPAVVGGVRLQMRSLGTGDLFMLQARTAGATTYEWRMWAVATSIWMIDGRTVLGHDNAIPFLFAYLNKMPKNAIDILFHILLGLWIRVGDATEAVEIYCYEVGSRYKWKTIGPEGVVRTGVPGADQLGMSVVQRIWTAFNEMEDIKRSEDSSWEGFKLVASSNAPKAIQKLDSNDRKRRENEVDKRQKRLDHFFYVKVGALKGDAAVEGADSSLHLMEGSKSVDTLEDEMRRWVTDDQDLHDRVISDYKAKIRVQRIAERDEQRSRMAALEAKRVELGWESGDFKPQPLVALTGGELQKLLRERGDGHLSGVSYLPKAPHADRLYDKYVGETPDSGQLQVQNGKIVNPDARPDADKRTLNELIKGRNPAFGSGE